MQQVEISSCNSAVQKLGPKLHFTPAPAWSEEESLVPGLPDDVAVNCLLRVPIAALPACRGVCRRWRRMFAGKHSFFLKRKEVGMREPWVFVFAFHRCTGEAHWQVLDLTHNSWHKIPPMPWRHNFSPHGFSCVTLPSKSSFLICGGMVSDIDSPLDIVLEFDMLSNRWTVASKMLSPRCYSAVANIDGLVYAAGGSSTNLFELSATEVLDSDIGKWKPIASMGVSMTACDSAALNGRLLVTEGWLWPFLFSPRGQVYDPVTNTWDTMTASLREGWAGSSFVLDGHLFVVSEHKKMRVKVYREELDDWETVDGSPVPDKIQKPFTLKSHEDNRVIIVGCDLHIVIGYLRRTMRRKEREWCFSIRWEVLDASQEFCGLAPSACQVLYG